MGIENNKLGIEYNAKQSNQSGDISFVWTDSKTEERSLEDGSLMFELVLKTKLGIDEAINNLQFTINNSIADIEAWDKDFGKHQIVLKSKVESQNLKAKNESFVVSPNPTTGNIIVNMVSKSNKNVVFELANIYGKILLQQSFEVVKGNNIYSIDLNKNNKLPTGIYFLKTIGLEVENVIRVMVK